MEATRRKMRLSHQINGHFCGPAAAVTALSAYGIHTTQRALARLARTNKATGTSTKGLVLALRSFGVHVRAKNGCTLSEIRQALPTSTIIVCYTESRSEAGHYAVVAGFKREHMLLLDPDRRGKRPVRLTLSEFRNRWKDERLTRSKRWAAFIARKA
ncbi:C39 family peptidase [Candidatus Kaiserbacteria bacterium]|nr:C39 family peptidase [Candidatus Kaiserbacteria bacterium]